MTDPFAGCHRGDMDIRQVNVFDDSEIERFHEVTERAEAFERPHHSGWSLDEAKIELRRQVPTERSEVWAAYDEGTMVTESAYPFDRREDHPYRRFAEANGFRVASFVDSLPDELIASYCALSNQLGVDAPTSPEPSPDVWQWGPLVHRDHRGHRLGTAVKVRNLQQLAAARSRRLRVLTCNAETNHHMVDINVRLGFEAVEVAPMFELRIDSSVGPRTEQRAQVSASTT